MWELDYEKIRNNVKNLKEMAIVTSKEHTALLEEIYPKIQAMNEDLEVFIVSGDNILCSCKFDKFGFYVILGVECPLHKFNNAVYLNFELSENEIDKIKQFKGKVIGDSTYNVEKYIKNDGLEGNSCLIVSKSMSFKRYYAIRENCIFINEYKGESKMDFLTTRINKAEKIRDKKIFAVIFTSRMFEELAVKVKNQIINSGRHAYLLHLKNVHYNRLITIEGVDVLVLIDCPLFNNLNIDIFIPIVTPCEVNYVLNGEWDGNYDENKINEKAISTCTDLTQVKGAGELIMQHGFVGIDYGHDDKDYKIYEGRSGIADSYEKEGE